MKFVYYLKLIRPIDGRMQFPPERTTTVNLLNQSEFLRAFFPKPCHTLVHLKIVASVFGKFFATWYTLHLLYS